MTAEGTTTERPPSRGRRAKLPVAAASTEVLTDLATRGCQHRRALRVPLLGRGLSSNDEGEAVGVDSDILAVQAGVGLCVGLEG